AWRAVLTARDPTFVQAPRPRRGRGSAQSRSASPGRARAGTPARRSRARDARVRVLHVVDRVLRRELGGEIHVDVDRLVRAALHEIPPRCVDADLVEEVVEEDDVAATLRHLRLLAALRQVHELVQQYLDAL